MANDAGFDRSHPSNAAPVPQQHAIKSAMPAATRANEERVEPAARFNLVFLSISSNIESAPYVVRHPSSASNDSQSCERPASFASVIAFLLFRLLPAMFNGIRETLVGPGSMPGKPHAASHFKFR